MAQKVIFLTATGAGQHWTVPKDWNSLNNTIECLGGGWAGGGAYAAKSNNPLTPGASVSYRVGSANADTDTWFNGADVASSNVGAKGGTASLGGAAASSVGDVRFSGGDSGGGPGSPGGGGAGGPLGAGANGTPGGDGGAANGGGETVWTQTSNGATASPGDGGGVGAPGGFYGGGGGSGSTGRQGIIVITYEPNTHTEILFIG